MSLLITLSLDLLHLQVIIDNVKSYKILCGLSKGDGNPEKSMQETISVDINKLPVGNICKFMVIKKVMCRKFVF